MLGLDAKASEIIASYDWPGNLRDLDNATAAAKYKEVVKDCLDARELIKLKVLESSMYNAREASVKLAEATGADCVQVIGSKFVLYLQKKKDSAYADLLK